MPDTSHLERYILELKEEKARVDEQLADAERLLAKATGQPTPARSKPGPGARPPKPVFERKYDKNAKTLILESLARGGGWMDTGKQRSAHKAQGYDFNPATYDLTLRELEKAALVERRDSPKKGRFKNQWRITDKGRAEVGISASDLRVA